MPQLIWTRALKDWDQDQSIFQKLKKEPLHLPCISTHGVPVKFPKQKPQVFVFTSANAVRYAARHFALVNLMKSAEIIYAIGGGTLETLKELNISGEVPPSVKSAEDLSIWLARNLAPGTIVAWPSARQPSYDLEGYLRRYNIDVEQMVVYNTDRTLHLPNGKLPTSEEITHFQETLEGIVCFASPSAVEGFTSSLMPQKNRLAKTLIAVAIGDPTKVAAEKYFEQVVSITEPRVNLLAETGYNRLASLKSNS
jgi:uroporphyrinogen-III synthase